MKKIIIFILTIICSTSIACADHQNFDAGPSQNIYSLNKYITGNQIIRIEKLLYAMSKKDLIKTYNKVNSKISEIQSANINFQEKSKLIGILTELQNIITNVVQDQNIDIDEVLQDVLDS